eukprot:g45988.t1
MVELLNQTKPPDFSTLYTSLPQPQLINRLSNYIRVAYLLKCNIARSTHLYFSFHYRTHSYNPPVWRSHPPPSQKAYDLFLDADTYISFLNFQIDNSFIAFGELVLQQTIGIPVNDCVHPADNFLFTYEFNFFLQLINLYRIPLIQSLALAERFLDDLLSLNNPAFSKYRYHTRPLRFSFFDTSPSPINPLASLQSPIQKRGCLKAMTSLSTSLSSNEAAFKVLSTEARELYLSTECERISAPVDSATFYREFVAQNKPVVIQGALKTWPALEKWSSGYLVSVVGDEVVTIDATPDGLGDAVVDSTWFVTPAEKRMTFREFAQALKRNGRTEGVLYCQHQNSSFTEEFKKLEADIDPSSLDFAFEAFGLEPDAINFWMGSSEAKSCLHSDPYENMYCVIAGEKVFTLYPPTDFYWLQRRWYKAARYEQAADGTFRVAPEVPERLVPWLDLPSTPPTRLQHATPMRVTLRPGEVLYLPSLWYHGVEQSEQTIAVNFWFDMKFDIKFAYFKFQEAVAGLVDPLVLHPEQRVAVIGQEGILKHNWFQNRDLPFVSGF